MGKRGKTYNKEVFLELVEKFLPVTTDDWEKLIPLYKAASNEHEERTAADLSRYYLSLSKAKKPTGASQPDSITRKLNKIRSKMDKKTFSGSYGILSEEESENSGEEEAIVTIPQSLSVVAAEEALLSSPMNLIKEVEGNNSSSAATTESGKKRKNESSDNKSKNSRNSGRVALGSILKDLVDHMKSPVPATIPTQSDFLHQELQELRKTNRALLETTTNLMIQLSTLLPNAHEADSN